MLSKQKQSVGQFKTRAITYCRTGFDGNQLKNPIKYGCGLASNKIKYTTSSKESIENFQAAL